MTEKSSRKDRMWLAYIRQDRQTQFRSEFGGVVDLQSLPTHLLRNVTIFSDLSESEAEDVAGHCVWARFTSGRQILVENDPTNDIFFVLEGTVSAKSFSANGREVTYNEIPQGGIFGEFSAIDGEMRSASIVTTDRALVARMTSPDFRDMLERYPLVALRLAEHLVAKMRTLTQRIFEFSTLTVRHRIRAELSRLAASGEEESDGTVLINPAPTHYELATRVSTHREAVSRELSQLASSGILKLSRRSITVLDIDGLRMLAESSNEE